MATSSFEVFLSGTNISSEAWAKALEAEDSELPELNESQREVARRMQIPSKEYARGVLAEEYSAERLRKRGEVLGRRINEILSGLGTDYRLDAILREGTNFRWIARIVAPQGVKNVSIPLDLADDVIDSGSLGVLDRLKEVMLAGVGRPELIRSRG